MSALFLPPNKTSKLQCLDQIIATLLLKDGMTRNQPKPPETTQNQPKPALPIRNRPKQDLPSLKQAETSGNKPLPSKTGSCDH